MIVVWLFIAVPRNCLQFVIIVVFPDHIHLLFLTVTPWGLQWTIVAFPGYRPTHFLAKLSCLSGPMGYGTHIYIRLE